MAPRAPKNAPRARRALGAFLGARGAINRPEGGHMVLYVRERRFMDPPDGPMATRV